MPKKTNIFIVFLEHYKYHSTFLATKSAYETFKRLSLLFDGMMHESILMIDGCELPYITFDDDDNRCVYNFPTIDSIFSFRKDEPIVDCFTYIMAMIKFQGEAFGEMSYKRDIR